MGKPAAMLLLQKNATVTICHSRTRKLDAVLKSADLIVAAIGRAHFVTRKMVKKGSIIIDVGIIKQGDNIFTPPKEINATHFPIKTTLIVCSRNKRNQSNYEKDTVRVDFINRKNLKKFL